MATGLKPGRKVSVGTPSGRPLFDGVIEVYSTNISGRDRVDRVTIVKRTRLPAPLKTSTRSEVS